MKEFQFGESDAITLIITFNKDLTYYRYTLKKTGELQI